MLETHLEVHGGKKLRVARMGTGHPVVLLHGYPENLQVFDLLLPDLTTQREAIAFDWPGMGQSEEWNGGATPLIMAGRLLSLLDAWKIEKADLVAQDMGGQPALVFAALYPDRVRKLVIMNSLVMGERETSWEIRWLRQFGLNKLLLLYFGRLVFWRAVYTFLPHRSDLDQELERDLWDSFSNVAVRRFIVRMCAGYEAQLAKLPGYYSRIKCPVLLLWGGKDRHFPPIQADALQGCIPHAKLEVLKDATHWMVLQRTQDVSARITAFLNASVVE